MSNDRILISCAFLLVLASHDSEALGTSSSGESEASPTPENNVSVYRMAGAGIAVGALGLLSGGIVAGVGCGDDGGEMDCIGSAIIGAIYGEALGMALGVHAGNRRRGRLIADVAVSAGYATGALVLFASGGTALADLDQDVLATAIAGQLASVIAMERMLGRLPENKNIAVSIVPFWTRGRGLKAILSVGIEK